MLGNFFLTISDVNYVIRNVSCMEIKLIQRKHETVQKRKRFYLFFPFSSIKLTIKIEKKANIYLKSN